MASITIRRLEDATKERLRIRASRNGRSMEEEAREILRAALAVKRTSKENWVDAIRRRIDAVGGIELPEVPRYAVREPPNFE